MKPLPIAKTEIREIAEGGFCYVDKTKFIKDLVDDNHKYYFLSRPRRFGKSLLVDTMRAAFAGEKKLFEGLYIEKNWDWGVKYPVVTISFASGSVETREELKIKLNELLTLLSEKLDVDITLESISGKFEQLIERLKEKYSQPVVVLIDEYDKPLLDNLTKENVEEIREELSSFYSVLKGASENLKFVFITGVSKFSKTSIFSKLNNITDISLHEKYADICGITQSDLESIFCEHLAGVDLAKIKEWYNGYCFRGSGLYNPYDVLMFLWEKRYKAYWFQTGTPTFLLELIKKRHFYVPDLENLTIAESQLEEFNTDNIDLNIVLFQAGYLTIKKEYNVGDLTFFDLKIPNKEVRLGLNEFLLNMFYAAGSHTNIRSGLYKNIYFAIVDKKPAEIEPAFKSFFASIPHEWYRRNNIAHFEGFYTSMFYAFFAAQGFSIVPEDFTNRGRIDLTVVTDAAVFIFEFKMNVNTENALNQIKNRKYCEKYLSHNKDIFLIGIEFDEEQKNISAFEWEKIQIIKPNLS